MSRRHVACFVNGKWSRNNVMVFFGEMRRVILNKLMEILDGFMIENLSWLDVLDGNP